MIKKEDRVIDINEIPIRLRNTCRNFFGMNFTVGQLINRKDYELLRWKNVGKETLAETIVVLKRSGLGFKN